jgi:hypothetical protein
VSDTTTTTEPNLAPAAGAPASTPAAPVATGTTSVDVATLRDRGAPQESAHASELEAGTERQPEGANTDAPIARDGGAKRVAT